ncbi:MAG: Ig-like domain-containing protein [Stagnimonas sp.]|nr:Ig-like domain-containing protein [Stagnimonas sp.]
MPAALTAVANPTQIVADGVSSARVTATLVDTVGVAIANAPITFESNAGNFSAASVNTDATGTATTLLRSSTLAGRATIIVRHPTSGLSQQLVVTYVPAAASIVRITASPSEVRPGGVSTLAISVTDPNGNPISGEPVSLSISANNSQGQLQATMVVSDASGLASTTYTAGTVQGADTIRAALTSGTAATANLTVQFTASAVGAVQLTTGSPTAVADGTSTTVLRATVTDTQSAPLPGVSVSFSATAGTLPSPPTATTNASGIAEVSLVSPTITGTASLTASTGGFTSTGSIQFVAGAARTLTLSPSPQALPPSGNSSVRATVVDAQGNRVSDATVNFALSTATGNAGGVLAANSVTTDANGNAAVQYTAPNVESGSQSVSATTTNGSNASTVLTISSANAQVTGLTLTPSATQVSASAQVAVRATVQVQSGSSNGITVNFSTSSGAIAATAKTDSSGVAVATLTAPAQPGSAQVTATVANFTQSTTVTVVSGNPSTISLVASPASTSINRPTTLVATVLDASSNPVQGVSVKFEVPDNKTGGTLATINVTTDANGRATTSYTAGSAAGSDMLRASVAVGSTTQSSQAKLVVVVNAARITLGTLAPLTADGSSQATLTATLFDNNGTPIPNANVSFATNLGTFGAAAQSSTAMTDANGVATTRITAPVVVGNAAISATVNGATASTPLQFVAGAPRTVTVTAAPATVAPGATSALTATVVDANNNRVTGSTVTFQVAAGGSAGGRVSAASGVTDINGQATVNYVAGSVANSSDSVAANVGGGVAQANQTINVSFVGQTVSALTLLPLGSSSVAAGGSAVAVRAQVSDQSGNPITNQTVTFTASAGDFGGSTLTTTEPTNGSGIASVNLAPPTFVSRVRIRAEIGGFAAEQVLSVVPGVASVPPSIITPNPQLIVADGVSTSTITVIQNDRFGNPLPDGTPVTLLSDNGTIVGSNTANLASGRVTFQVRSATSQGQANLRVQDVPGLTEKLNFQSATDGVPASLSFVSSTQRLSVIGVGQGEQATITVSVADSSGNLIKESGYGTTDAALALNNLRAEFVTRPSGGESLTGNNANNAVVSDLNGVLDVRTQGGVAVITLRSGTRPGIVEVRFSVLAFNTNGGFGSGTETVAARASLPQVSIASGPPTTIVFTNPVSNSVANLGGGSYQRRGQVIVTDRYGNSVPDGTVVNFGVIDSVMMHDNSGGTTAGAATLTRNGPSLITRRCTTEPLNGGIASSCNPAPSDFTSPITRNDVPRRIQANDTVLLRNATDGDKRRFVAVDPSATPSKPAPTAMELSVHKNYGETNTMLEMWVGAALSGGEIFGFDASGTNLSKGTGIVKDGIADFRLTYPANARSILTGCYGYPSANGAYDARDLRDAVPQSRQVVVSADSGTTATTIRNGTFCFTGIAPVVVSVDSNSVRVPPGAAVPAVGLTLTDSGDGVSLPFFGYTCAVTTLQTGGSWTPTVSVQPNADNLPATEISGRGAIVFSATGTSTPTDTATVVCSTPGGTSTTINLSP